MFCYNIIIKTPFHYIKMLPLQICTDSILVYFKNQTPYLVVETGIPTPIVEATTQDLI